MAAAGPLQVAAAIFSFRDGVVPPTANLEVPIPEAPLDFVRGEARCSFPETALLNAHGVGGSQCHIAFESTADESASSASASNPTSLKLPRLEYSPI